jgi:predicted O-methyltransferase YrrM
MNRSGFDLLQQILAEQPKFHTGEPEVQGRFAPPADTVLTEEQRATIASHQPFFMGIDTETARFLLETIGPSSVTLETGAGVSTITFALGGGRHTTVTPNEPETVAIREYAAARGISTAGIRFVAEASEKFLPRLEDTPLDLVLIDGKHAFPWPIIDWFYTADKLKKGGIVVLDDTQLRSVAMLRDFLGADPAWKSAFQSSKAIAFRKTRDSVHNVPWYMQPFVAAGYAWPQPSLPQRVTRALRRIFKN